MDKTLMSLKEVMAYTGWKETYARKVLNKPTSVFTVRCGNRLYVHKELFDKYLERCAKYKIKI